MGCSSVLVFEYDGGSRDVDCVRRRSASGLAGEEMPQLPLCPLVGLGEKRFTGEGWERRTMEGRSSRNSKNIELLSSMSAS